jgi:UTP--glucose-1-phosphate uridylyltransferase
MIKDYFYNDVFFRQMLKKKKKDKQLKLQYLKIRKLKKMIKFVYQNSPRGTGDAVLRCKRLIKSKHFLMLLPDDLILKSNCSSAMLKPRVVRLSLMQ